MIVRDATRKRFGEIVQRHGWTGWTGSESKAGTAWRTRVIYRTNMATSYAAGRLAQLKHFPLWVYKHSGAEHPRLQHLAWNGLTLPADHEFWATNYPPNGWGCGCRVVGASSEKAARRLGGNPDYDSPPPGWNVPDAKGRLPGIDEGWDYPPGATRQPWDKDDALRMEAPSLLPKAASRQAAVAQLASVLGVSAAMPRRWIETEIPVPALSKVMIEYGYLAHMVDKDHDARERYAHFILPTLIRPFEAWATLYDDGSIRPRLISLFRGKRQIAVILRINRDGSLFYNVMNADDKRIDDFRVGELLYGR